MAYSDLAGIPRPLFPAIGYANGGGSMSTMNSDDDWVAWIFSWPGGDLTKCAFIATTANSSPVVTAQLFNVDGSGNVDTASAIGSAVDSTAMVANTPKTVTGIGQSSLSAGVYALRVIWKSGGSMQLLRHYGNATLIASTTIVPYAITVQDGGAQTRQATTSLHIALGGDDWRPLLGCMPPALIVGVNAQESSNPDEFGLWFANPFPVGIKISGAMIYSSATSRPDIRVAYYTGSLASPSQDFTVTQDKDQTSQAGAAGWHYVPFGTEQTLAAGASAGIGVRAGASVNFGFTYWDFKAGNEALMHAYWGEDATLFTREGDTGALTQVTYQTPFIVPVYCAMDSGSGSSGGVVVPTHYHGPLGLLAS